MMLALALSAAACSGPEPSRSAPDPDPRWLLSPGGRWKARLSAGSIQVFEADGRFAGRIPMPANPSNCTFGGADRKTLYVTTLHAVYEVRMATPGLP